MSVGDVLSEAWGLYTRFFWRLVGTAAIVFVVLDLLSAVFYSVRGHSAGAGVFWGLLTLLVTLVGSFWVQGALVLAVQDVRDGRADSTIGELYVRVRPRLPALISAGILAGIGIVIGFLLIVPGVFLLTRWSLIVPAIVLETRSVGESFARSNELVKGASWSVLGVILVTAILAGIANVFVGGIFGAVFTPFLGVWIGGLVTHSLTVPFVAAAWTLMYFKRAAG